MEKEVDARPIRVLNALPAVQAVQPPSCNHGVVAVNVNKVTRHCQAPGCCQEAKFCLSFRTNLGYESRKLFKERERLRCKSLWVEKHKAITCSYACCGKMLESVLASEEREFNSTYCSKKVGSKYVDWCTIEELR